MAFQPKTQKATDGKPITLWAPCPQCGYTTIMLDWKFNPAGDVRQLVQCNSDYCSGCEYILTGEGKLAPEDAQYGKIKPLKLT